MNKLDLILANVKMTENASHVVVHHHIDNASTEKLINMACCIVLSVVIILILTIILAVVVYLLLQRSKSKPDTVNACYSTPATHQHVNKVELSNSHRGISNPAASFEDNETDINSNRRSIHTPATRRGTTAGDRSDSSESSGGLCEVLFPQPHEGEVICQPPPKVVAFAGKVYPTTVRSDSTRTRLQPEPRPSASSTRRSTNASMEWDYLELRRYGTSNASAESDQRYITDVCWV